LCNLILSAKCKTDQNGPSMIPVQTPGFI